MAKSLPPMARTNGGLALLCLLKRHRRLDFRQDAHIGRAQATLEGPRARMLAAELYGHHLHAVLGDP